MTTEQVQNKKTTVGYFDVIGEVAVDNKCFAMNQVGKNNANWISHVFNPKVDAGNGQSMYMRFQCGYDKVKGKLIKKMSTTATKLEIPFADRLNPNMINLVDEKGFMKIGIAKKTEVNKDTGKEFKVWDFVKFLDGYDVVEYLSKVMPLASKQKIRMTGTVKHTIFNGEVRRNYELQTIYLLNNNEDEDKIMTPKLAFTHNVLLTEGCVDTSKLESEGIATINAKLYTFNKGNIEVLPVPFIMRSENIEATNRVINKYLNPPQGIVRKINLDCLFESGYVAGNIDENDLPQDARELIEDGLYSKEEVLRMYASKERVDRLVCVRPISKPVADAAGNTSLKADMDDAEYTLDDLEGKTVEIAQEETIVSETETKDLLDELEKL